MIQQNSKTLFDQAKKIIPGGVNSPVRAFKSVGGDPLFIKKAAGPYLFDEDGNRFIELINSWGPMILGHAHPKIEEAVSKAIKDSFSFGAPSRKEVEMAELVCELVPSVEMVRMVNSGTEATMAAIRVARGYTGKDKIIKFEGCYHGHGDSFLIAAGSGVVTMGFPDSPGVTKHTAEDTLTAPYNNIDAVKNLVDANKGKIAAIIVEPVVGNMGCVLPQNNFLQELRTLCTKENIVLIFDEVMTGFRLSIGGAQKRYGVMPDLTTMGKIIGGGMPVGAYGGKKEIMEMVAPAGPIYQAGTLSGNPIAMSAGLAMLNELKNTPSIYADLENTTKKLVDGISTCNEKLGLKYTINQIGSMYTLFFTDSKVDNFEEAKTSNVQQFAKYFRSMLEEGVYLAPSQYESLFVSTSITSDIVDKILAAHKVAIEKSLN
jgi:glutamate-1-semialdehyde 2,1-aminomutase